MCFLKCKNYEAAVLQCTEGLKIFPRNIKLRYILGCAYGETGDYESALEALKDAKELDPTNRDITEKISLYAKAKKDYNIKMKEMFGGKLKPVIKKDPVSEVETQIIDIKPMSNDKPQENSTNYAQYAAITIGTASLLYLGYLLLKKAK
jgi:tetratricopeptide (TPR) repeat protein